MFKKQKFIPSSASPRNGKPFIFAKNSGGGNYGMQFALHLNRSRHEFFFWRHNCPFDRQIGRKCSPMADNRNTVLLMTELYLLLTRGIGHFVCTRDFSYHMFDIFNAQQIQTHNKIKYKFPQNESYRKNISESSRLRFI